MGLENIVKKSTEVVKKSKKAIKDFIDNPIPKLKQFGEDTLLAATVITAVTTPVFALTEVTVGGVSDDVSINARLINAGALYLGGGIAYDWGRGIWHSVFKVPDEKKKKNIHDGIYGVSTYLATLFPFYYFSGANLSTLSEWLHIGLVGGVGLATMYPVGLAIGYGLDITKDLFGVKESRRTPSIVREWIPSAKKTVGAFCLGVGMAAALLSTHFIYNLTPDEETKKVISQQYTPSPQYNIVPAVSK